MSFLNAKTSWFPNITIMCSFLGNINVVISHSILINFKCLNEQNRFNQFLLSHFSMRERVPKLCILIVLIFSMTIQYSPLLESIPYLFSITSHFISFQHNKTNNNVAEDSSNSISNSLQLT